MIGELRPWIRGIEVASGKDLAHVGRCRKKLMIFAGESASYYETSTPSRPRACTGEKKGSPLKLQDLREKEKNVFDVADRDIHEIRAFLENEDGKLAEWFDGKLIIKTEGDSIDISAEWIVGPYFTFMEERGWTMGRTTHVPGNDRAFIPDAVAKYMPERPLTPHQAAHAMTLKPMPHWVLECEWEGRADQDGKGFHKVIHLLFPMVGSDGSRIEEAWVIVLPSEPATPMPVAGIPGNNQPVILPQHDRPASGTPYLAVLRRVYPPDQGITYYPLLPNTRFAVPDYSVFSANGPAGAPGVPPRPVNHMLHMARYIDLMPVAPPPLPQAPGQQV